MVQCDAVSDPRDTPGRSIRCVLEAGHPPVGPDLMHNFGGVGPYTVIIAPLVGGVEALRTIEELERIYGYRIDAILPDGTHRYFSTHCRHDSGDGEGHKACAADSIQGRASGLAAFVVSADRRPAQCKTCAAPCACPCHRGDGQP